MSSGRKAWIEIGRAGGGGEEDKPRARTPAPGLERIPARTWRTGNHLVEIVHAGAPEGAVGGREAGRLDDVRLDTETGGEAQDHAGVLGDVGLVERNPHRSARGRSANRERGQNLRRTRHLCDFWPLRHGPLALPLARVPIKRRWIKPLGLLHPGWRAVGSLAAAERRLHVGSGKRPHAGKFTRPFGCGRTDDKKGTAQVTTMSAAEGTRRDFLYIATGAVAAVGAAGVLWCR